MAWPSADEIISAMSNSNNCLDPYIRGKYECFTMQRRRMTIPISYEGGFACAFKMKRPDNSSRIFFRVYTKNLAELVEPFEQIQRRYEQINTFVNTNRQKLPYFVKSVFLREALLVNGRRIPGVRMDCVDGTPLGEYLVSCRDTSSSANEMSMKRSFRLLASEFYTMAQTLKSLGMAHGDLSCENIIVTDNKHLVLVDYDSVYVPAMGNNCKQTTTGAKAFQHPKRVSGMYASARDDDFSVLVIYSYLLGLSKDLSPLKYCSETELYSKQDFTNEQTLKDSFVYKSLSRINDPEVNRILGLLVTAVKGKLSEVPSLFGASGTTTSVRYVNFCTNCGFDFRKTDYSHCIMCGVKRLRLI